MRILGFSSILFESGGFLLKWKKIKKSEKKANLGLTLCWGYLTKI